MDLQWSGVMERCYGATEGSMFGVINGGLQLMVRWRMQ